MKIDDGSGAAAARAGTLLHYAAPLERHVDEPVVGAPQGALQHGRVTLDHQEAQWSSLSNVRIRCFFLPSMQKAVCDSACRSFFVRFRRRLASTGEEAESRCPNVGRPQHNAFSAGE